MNRPESTSPTGRSPGSRLLWLLDRWAGRPSIALTIVAAAAIWVLFSALVGFPTKLETVFQAVVAALTLSMVFVIQHTQARQQVATQRELDEILRSISAADNTVIALEEADDHTLRSTRDAHRELRHNALQHHPDEP